MAAFGHLLLFLLAVPPLAACAYLAAATLLSAALRPPPAPPRRLRFDLIVPAHDEATVLPRTLASVAKLNWPAQNLRVTVIADHCTDATAALARAAGAEVLEREDPAPRGKGAALHEAFTRSAQRGWGDAVVVIDADTEVSPNLLEAIAARLERGEQAVQVHYGVLDPRASWRTRLMAIAQAAFHRVRSRARERLGISCGIRGNGWCVTHELLWSLPFEARSVVEDVEYGAMLGLAGVRVAYVDEAEVLGEAATAEKVARHQRRRWEGGRIELRRQFAGPLLDAAFARRNLLCLDLAFDLLLPPLATLALQIVTLALAGSLLALWQPALLLWTSVAAGCAAVLALHVLRGWQLSGIGMRGLADLAGAPLYVIWKLSLRLRDGMPVRWIPTKREPT